MKRLQFAFALLLISAGGAAVAAQENTTGSIAGRVIDAQNLPIPGATVDGDFAAGRPDVSRATPMAGSSRHS